MEPEHDSTMSSGGRLKAALHFWPACQGTNVQLELVETSILLSTERGH